MVVVGSVDSAGDLKDRIVLHLSFNDPFLVFHFAEQQILNHLVVKPLVNQFGGSFRRHPLVENPRFSRFEDIDHRFPLAKTNATGLT